MMRIFALYPVRDGTAPDGTGIRWEMSAVLNNEWGTYVGGACRGNTPREAMEFAASLHGGGMDPNLVDKPLPI